AVQRVPPTQAGAGSQEARRVIAARLFGHSMKPRSGERGFISFCLRQRGDRDLSGGAMSRVMTGIR
ncbi:MAG: hypothetical protein ACK55O_14990, partial [Phycisphaerales bacterium]